MEEELKPCPFCGSKHIGLQHVNEQWQCYCILCWANRGWFDTKEDAIKHWNRRGV